MSFVLAEGAYTSYAVHDSFDDTTISYLRDCAAWVNCLETQAILLQVSSNASFKVYDIDAKTLGSTIYVSRVDYGNTEKLSWKFKQTLLNTYAAFIQTTTRDLLIYKNGALLQTLTPTDLGLTTEGEGSISFSPRGKYIFIAGTRVSSGNKGWVVLKGT